MSGTTGVCRKGPDDAGENWMERRKQGHSMAVRRKKEGVVRTILLDVERVSEDEDVGGGQAEVMPSQAVLELVAAHLARHLSPSEKKELLSVWGACNTHNSARPHTFTLTFTLTHPHPHTSRVLCNSTSTASTQGNATAARSSTAHVHLGSVDHLDVILAEHVTQPARIP
eukprot:410652-Rhodomonas_salina.1